jgi:hypothetical protein
MCGVFAAPREGRADATSSAPLRPCMIYWADMDWVSSGNPMKVFKGSKGYLHYIEGSVPAGMKIKRNFDGFYVLDIQKKGGLTQAISVYKANPMVPADFGADSTARTQLSLCTERTKKASSSASLKP